MKKVIIILIILFIAGGFAAVALGAQAIWETIKAMCVHIFPVFSPVFTQALEDYVTSAYFIVGIIIFALSSVGIYLSVRFKKGLFLVVSIVVDIISLISIISNFASCR